MIIRKKLWFWFGFCLYLDLDDNKIDWKEIYGCFWYVYYYNVFSVLLEYIIEIEKISFFFVVLLIVLLLRIFFFIIEIKNIIFLDWR